MLSLFVRSKEVKSSTDSECVRLEKSEQMHSCESKSPKHSDDGLAIAEAKQ